MGDYLKLYESEKFMRNLVSPEIWEVDLYRGIFNGKPLEVSIEHLMPSRHSSYHVLAELDCGDYWHGYTYRFDAREEACANGCGVIPEDLARFIEKETGVYCYDEGGKP